MGPQGEYMKFQRVVFALLLIVASILLPSCTTKSGESEEIATKSSGQDYWGSYCGEGTNLYHVCVQSSPAQQIIFQMGPVAKGDHRPDPQAVRTWTYSGSFYSNSACIDIPVCASQSLRWNAQFTTSVASAPNHEWFACSLYQPMPYSRQVWENGSQLSDGATSLVQNPSPAGDGRNCQDD